MASSRASSPWTSRWTVTVVGWTLLQAGCGSELKSEGDLLESLPTMSVVQRLQLGAVDDEVLAFSRIGDVAVGVDGHIYVLQPLDGQVLVLTHDGRLVRRIGGRGEGPGELMSPGGLGWISDTLWVVDVGTRRISYFVDGEPVRSHSYGNQPSRENRFITIQLPLRDGTFAGIVGPEVAGPDEAPTPTPILRFDADGSQLSHLAELRHDYPTRIRFGNTRTSTLFHDLPLFEVSRRGDRIVVVERPLPDTERSELRVHAIAPTGDTLFTTRLLGRAVPISDELWEQRLQERREALPNPTISEQDYLAAVRRPRALPPASGIVVSADGWVWIAREDVATSDERQWVVLDADGLPRFRIDLPRAFRVQDVVDGHIWGVATDSLDIPYVRMYETTR